MTELDIAAKIGGLCRSTSCADSLSRNSRVPF